MKKSKKNINQNQSLYTTYPMQYSQPYQPMQYSQPYQPIQYSQPMQYSQHYQPIQYYYPGKRTKKNRIDDFNHTYGQNFNPKDMFKKPIKKLVFKQNDDIYKFTKNILDLYNIDYNPNFVDFSINNFRGKIDEYLSHFRNNNLYLNSIKGIRKSSDLLELEKVLNEHELHSILEGIDLMFKYSDYKKINFNQRNPKREQEIYDFIMDEENMKKLSNKLIGGGLLDNLSGGGHVAKYDIIAYVNGDKRNKVKKRIADIIYIHNNTADINDGKAISNGAEGGAGNTFPIDVADFKQSVSDSLTKLKNDETIDNCFNAFIQQKVLTHLGINSKDDNPYYRGEFQKITPGCLKKNLFNTHIFYNDMPILVYENKEEGEESTDYAKKFERSKEKNDKFNNTEKYKKINDDFEFLESRSKINVEYLSYLYRQGKESGGNEKSKEQLEELIELINVYHELQIPDTVMARNKEKMMKKYLSKISMVIIVLGMLPPDFFGPDNDYNIFDVLSTVMCIFEGSTICAIMSALPLFSPILDALSTFAFIRKIMNKFGMSGAMGKRSKAAITKAREAKVNKIKKQQETLAQVQTNIHKQNINLRGAQAKGGTKGAKEASDIKKNLKELGEQNRKLTAQVEKQATKALEKAEKVAKAEAKGIEKVMRKIKKGDGLSDVEKMKITKHREHLELQLGAATKSKKTGEVNKIKAQINNFEKSVKGDKKLDALSDLGRRNANYALKGATEATEQAKTATDISRGGGVYKGKDTPYKDNAVKYEEYMKTKDLSGTISSGKVKPFSEKPPDLDDAGKFVFDHPGMQKLHDQFPGKFDPSTGKPYLTADGSMTFTAQEAKLMSKSADDALSAGTGKFLENQLNLATKKLNLAQSGKFGLTELSYLKATHPGRFKDSKKSIESMTEELVKLEKAAKETKVAQRAQKKAANAEKIAAREAKNAAKKAKQAINQLRKESKKIAKESIEQTKLRTKKWQVWGSKKKRTKRLGEIEGDASARATKAHANFVKKMEAIPDGQLKKDLLLYGERELAKTKQRIETWKPWKMRTKRMKIDVDGVSPEKLERIKKLARRNTDKLENIFRYEKQINQLKIKKTPLAEAELELAEAQLARARRKAEYDKSFYQRSRKKTKLEANKKELNQLKKKLTKKKKDLKEYTVGDKPWDKNYNIITAEIKKLDKKINMDLKLGPSSKDIRILEVKRDLVKAGVPTGNIKDLDGILKSKEKLKWDTFKEILGNVDPVVGVKLYRDAKVARDTVRPFGFKPMERYRKITRLKDAKKLRQARVEKKARALGLNPETASAVRDFKGTFKKFEDLFGSKIKNPEEVVKLYRSMKKARDWRITEGLRTIKRLGSTKGRSAKIKGELRKKLLKKGLKDNEIEKLINSKFKSTEALEKLESKTPALKSLLENPMQMREFYRTLKRADSLAITEVFRKSKRLLYRTEKIGKIQKAQSIAEARRIAKRLQIPDTEFKAMINATKSKTVKGLADEYLTGKTAVGEKLKAILDNPDDFIKMQRLISRSKDSVRATEGVRSVKRALWRRSTKLKPKIELQKLGSSILKDATPDVLASLTTKKFKNFKEFKKEFGDKMLDPEDVVKLYRQHKAYHDGFRIKEVGRTLKRKIPFKSTKKVQDAKFEKYLTETLTETLTPILGKQISLDFKITGKLTPAEAKIAAIKVEAAEISRKFMKNFEGGVKIKNYDDFLKNLPEKMKGLSSENLANIYRTLKETTQMQKYGRRTKMMRNKFKRFFFNSKTTKLVRGEKTVDALKEGLKSPKAQKQLTEFEEILRGAREGPLTQNYNSYRKIRQGNATPAEIETFIKGIDKSVDQPLTLAYKASLEGDKVVITSKAAKAKKAAKEAKAAKAKAAKAKAAKEAKAKAVAQSKMQKEIERAKARLFEEVPGPRAAEEAAAAARAEEAAAVTRAEKEAATRAEEAATRAEKEAAAEVVKLQKQLDTAKASKGEDLAALGERKLALETELEKQLQALRNTKSLNNLTISPDSSLNLFASAPGATPEHLQKLAIKKATLRTAGKVAPKQSARIANYERAIASSNMKVVKYRTNALKKRVGDRVNVTKKRTNLSNMETAYKGANNTFGTISATKKELEKLEDTIRMKAAPDDAAIQSLRGQLKNAEKARNAAQEAAEAARRAAQEAALAAKPVAQKKIAAEASKMKSQFEYLKLEEAVKPLKDPVEQIQWWLDKIASSYLIEYNIDEEYQSQQDIEMDKEYSDMHNKLLEQVWSKNAQNSVFKMGKMLTGGTQIGQIINLTRKASLFSNLNKQENIDKQMHTLRKSKLAKGINKRKKERLLSGKQFDSNMILRDRSGKTLTPDQAREIYFEQNLRRGNDNNFLSTSNQGKFNSLSSESILDIDRELRYATGENDDTTVFGLEGSSFRIDRKGIDNKAAIKRCYEIGGIIRPECYDGEMRVKAGKLMRKSCCVSKEELAPDAMLGNEGKRQLDLNKLKQNLNTRRKEEYGREYETDIKIAGNKQRRERENKEEREIKEAREAEAREAEAREAEDDEILNEPDEEEINLTGLGGETSVGGGKKKISNLTMRNEVINDSQLRVELSKFENQYKREMEEYNEPLEELMKKRSQYKIKQKKDIKEKYLELYRGMRRDILKLPDKEIKQLEFETFESQNNFYTNKKQNFFKIISNLSRNSLTMISVQLGTYYECKKLIIKQEEIEEKINKMMEDDEVKKFTDKFNKIFENITKKESEIKGIKKKIQNFKANEEDLEKAKQELKELKQQQKNYKGETDKEKKYMAVSSKKKEIYDQIDETKIFIKKNKEMKNKKKISVESCIKLKKGFFDMLKNILIDEVDFVQNEYNIAHFFSLSIDEIKKMSIIDVLQSIYIDIFKVKKSFEIANEYYQEENTKINVEMDLAVKQIEFFYTTLRKIKKEEDREIFKKRFKNRKENLELLKAVQKHLVDEYIDNLNVIDKCNDLLFYCDAQINEFKNINIMKETKTKLLTDNTGLIDINELHEKQLDRDIDITHDELINILDNILIYRKTIHSSRVKLAKTIANKHDKISKIKKQHKQSFNNKNEKRTKKLSKQIMTLDKRISDYERINIQYLTIDKPIDLLIFYRILNQTINKEGREQYSFDETTLNYHDIPIDKKLKDKLKEFNEFLKVEII